MNVLALDTTTRSGSAALVVGTVIVDERAGDGSRTHAERLPAEILAIAAGNRTTLAGVDLFAVAAGPGSFTGLRIGIATMQGFAFVEGRRMVGVSALEALAHLGSRELGPGACVGAWMDGYRRDVFAALYRVANAPLFDPDRLVELEAPFVGSPDETWARWSTGSETPAVVIGDGALRYREAISGAGVEPSPLLAGAVGVIAAHRAARGESVHPAAIHPLYVRRPDAEVARDAR